MKYILICLTVGLSLSACGVQTGSGPVTASPSQGTPVPVGTPSGTLVRRVIGTAGGTLSTPDGAVRLDIPAGALADNQTVSLQPITRTAPSGTGQAYRLSPEGLTFAVPVRLTFTYTDNDVQGSAPQALSAGFQDARGVWQFYRKPTRDLRQQTITVETRHFSDWSLLEGAQLQPLKADVEVGQALPLQVVSCLQPEGSGDSELLPIKACGPFEGAVTTGNWAANGVTGGDASAGTVTAVGSPPGRAVYTAPARLPSRNPVAVSVDMADGVLGNLTLVAHATVKAPTAWQGQVFYTETGRRPWKMQDGFEGAGSEYARQTHTFKVVGVKSADALNTVLLLEQEGAAEYSDIGHMEKKVYEICEAFGPTVLRHHFIYDRDFRMSGSVNATLEARLRIEDGQYTLSFVPQDVLMTGQDRITDLYKDGCAGTTNDRSNVRAMKDSAGLRHDAVAGSLDAGHPDVLTGKVEGPGELSTQPTQYLLSWNLTRTP